MAELVSKCGQCQPTRKALALLVNELRRADVALMGFVADDQPGAQPRRVNHNSLTIRCPVCKDTQAVLTPHGQQLAALVAAAIASGQQLRADAVEAPANGDDEMPF